MNRHAHNTWIAALVSYAILANLAVAQSPAPAVTEDANVKLNFPDQVELTLLVEYVSQRLGVKILYDERRRLHPPDFIRRLS
jgi:hypothetical protein